MAWLSASVVDAVWRVSAGRELSGRLADVGCWRVAEEEAKMLSKKVTRVRQDLLNAGYQRQEGLSSHGRRIGRFGGGRAEQVGLDGGVGGCLSRTGSGTRSAGKLSAVAGAWNLDLGPRREVGVVGQVDYAKCWAR